MRRTITGLVLGALFVAPSGVLAATQAAQVGQAYAGRLEAGDDTYTSGEFVDYYEITGRAGQSVTAVLTSDEVDPYLSMHPPTGDAIGDDDGGGGRAARISVTFPANGVYRFGATTYAPGESGAYRLTFEEGISGGAPTVAAGDASGRVVVEGTLGEGDRQLRDTNEYYDHHFVDVQAGDRVVVTTISEADTYLIVEAPGMEQQDDDDGGGGINARIAFTAAQTGECEIMVTTSSAGQSGPYTLVVEGATPYRGGERYEGTLAAGDSTLPSGEFEDEYSVFARAGEAIEVTLRSFEFDSYLIVHPPQGEQTDNDDGRPDWRDARVSLTAPVEGNYRITCTSFQAGETGRYTLFVRRPSGESAAPTASSGRQTFRGELAAGDATLGEGEFYDSYSFDGQAGQTVTITMSSTAVDSYLVVVPPEGQQIDNDDMAQGNRNAQVVTTLSAAGSVRIMATSLTGGETGAYELTIDGATTRLGQNSSQAVTTARNYWAIVAGITNYGGEANDLPRCREDAEKLAGGLIYDGILRPTNLRLLVDEEATADNIRAAFREISPRIGADDVFLFFYSGHGMQGEPGSSHQPTEPDERDESIYVRGGAISDDEMCRLFDGIQAKVSILCLDSCFSGGFQKDVICQPRRVGLFSSDEDLTSAVAEEFKAGGYMSYFFRRGIRGEADEDHNRVVTVGELCKFLDDEFRKVNVQSSTSEGATGHQRMVYDRGGVRITEELARVAEPE